MRPVPLCDSVGIHCFVPSVVLRLRFSVLVHLYPSVWGKPVGRDPILTSLPATQAHILAIGSLDHCIQLRLVDEFLLLVCVNSPLDLRNPPFSSWSPSGIFWD